MTSSQRTCCVQDTSLSRLQILDWPEKFGVNLHSQTMSQLGGTYVCGYCMLYLFSANSTLLFSGTVHQRFCSAPPATIVQWTCGQSVVLLPRSTPSVLSFQGEVKSMRFSGYVPFLDHLQKYVSAQNHLLYLIHCTVFLQSDWNEGLKLASAMNLRFPRLVSTPLSSVIPSASEAGIDLMEALLHWDPHCRPSATHVRNEGKEGRGQRGRKREGTNKSGIIPYFFPTHAGSFSQVFPSGSIPIYSIAHHSCLAYSRHPSPITATGTPPSLREALLSSITSAFSSS